MNSDPQDTPASVCRVLDQYGQDVAISPESPVARLLLELERVAATRAPIILWGEPGVGRTTLAHVVHAIGSPTDEEPFVRIRAAYQGEGEIMNALFGRDRDPTRGRVGAGALNEARGGTLLLESVEDLPAQAQLWLCDVLEGFGEHANEGVRPPRIVATSTTDPTRLVDDGDLREELFYLLGVFVAHIPPLRERRADIPVLADHFLRRANRRLRVHATGFTQGAIAQLMRSAWLGNASELRNVVEHAALFAGEGPIGVKHLPDAAAAAVPSPGSPRVVVPVGTSVADAERKLILATLEHTGFNKAEAARTLDVDVKTVRAKLRTYGI